MLTQQPSGSPLLATIPSRFPHLRSLARLDAFRSFSPVASPSGFPVDPLPRISHYGHCIKLWNPVSTRNPQQILSRSSPDPLPIMPRSCPDLVTRPHTRARMHLSAHARTHARERRPPPGGRVGEGVRYPVILIHPSLQKILLFGLLFTYLLVFLHWFSLLWWFGCKGKPRRYCVGVPCRGWVVSGVVSGGDYGLASANALANPSGVMDLMVLVSSEVHGRILPLASLGREMLFCWWLLGIGLTGFGIG